MKELENFRRYLTEEQSSEQEAAFDKEFLNAADDIAGALEKELKSKKPEQLKEEIILATISAILTANAVIGFVSKYAAKLAKLLNWKKGEDFAEKVHHWAHDNEKAFQAPIKRILSLFIKDAKALDIMTKATYALIVGGMAANYGIEAVNQLSNSSWFSGALTALKTVAKGDETIVNAYPALKALFT